MLLANRTLSKDQQVPLTGEISMKKCVVPFYSELFEQIWLFSAVQALWRDEKRLMGFARLCNNMLGKNHIEYAVRKLFANCRELLLFTYVAKNELFVLTAECPINLNMNFSSLNLKRGSCSSEQLWDNPFRKWELPHSLDKFVSLLEQIWCQIKGTRLVTVQCTPFILWNYCDSLTRWNEHYLHLAVTVAFKLNGLKAAVHRNKTWSFFLWTLQFNWKVVFMKVVFLNVVLTL